MTPEEIKKAKELCNKATGGSWTWEEDSILKRKIHTVYAGRDDVRHGFNLLGRLEVDANGKNNLEFICNARDILPRALDRIEELEKELARERSRKSTSTPRRRPRPPGAGW